MTLVVRKAGLSVLPNLLPIPPHIGSQRGAWIKRQQIKPFSLEVVVLIESESWENSWKFPSILVGILKHNPKDFICPREGLLNLHEQMIRVGTKGRRRLQHETAPDFCRNSLEALECTGYLWDLMPQFLHLLNGDNINYYGY